VFVVFERFRRKKGKTGGLPRKDSLDNEGIQGEILERARERAAELVALDEDIYRHLTSPKRLNFVKTHHEVLKVLYKIPVGDKGVFKEVVTLGYVRGIAISPEGLLVISYIPRPPSWLDELAGLILRVFGRGQPVNLLWVLPQYAPLPSLDYAIVVEASRIIKTAWGEFALPPLLTEEEVATFKAAYMKAKTLEDLVDKLLGQMGQLVDTSLRINPFVKTYSLVERAKDKRKATERVKEATGTEVIIDDAKSVWDVLEL